MDILSQYEEIIPGSEAIGFDCNQIIAANGAIHCITMKVPAMIEMISCGNSLGDINLDQIINIFDHLSFQTTSSRGEIKFECSDAQLNTKSNIVFKVAKYLQSLTENPSGVVISLKKNIPVGAGLGGGSSNAASTLVALNEIWSLKLSRENLHKIGESFGSDVPFFVFGENAYGLSLIDI